MNDLEIVELYWKRSDEAITETARKYNGYCSKIATNILSNPEDAEECVNDTYFQTWNSIPTQRPDSLAAFLGKITRNLSINRYKQRRATKRGGGKVDLILHELEDCIPDRRTKEVKEDSELLAKTINQFLRELEQQTRMVFVRRYWYSDSIRDISQRYKMSESKVKSMLFRTRKRLRYYLEKEGISL